MRSHRIHALGAVVLAAACRGDVEPRAGGDALAPPATPAALRPTPGADVTDAAASLPAAAPALAAPHPRAAAPIDLGADRPLVAIALPEPPRGGAASFTFADQREGWVARIPEQNQLPSVAYGDGRIYVSGGFESTSM